MIPNLGFCINFRPQKLKYVCFHTAWSKDNKVFFLVVILWIEGLEDGNHFNKYLDEYISKLHFISITLNTYFVILVD